ncbi:PKD domain-containing protein [uncultured Microscilla sp.]|uniref:PKD domain-containing protein n=1 Tax=uncultured Microscilla sp. TaxID=432653 RepID=UPI002609BE37|nr:PKD domain-containing protein [uncultured Microscilla sp.]
MKFTVINQPVTTILSWLLLAFLPIASAHAGRPYVTSFKITNLAGNHTFGDYTNDFYGVPMNAFSIEIEFDEDFRSAVTTGAMITSVADIVAMFELYPYYDGTPNSLVASNMVMSNVDITHSGKKVTVLLKLKNGLRSNTWYRLKLKTGGVQGKNSITGNWSRDCHSEELDFKTTKEISITTGTSELLCPNDNETTISPIIIAEQDQYSFTPGESHTLTLEMSDPDFVISNLSSGEIKAEMYGLGATQGLPVSLVGNEINIDISVDGSAHTSGSLIISGIRVKYQGTTNKSGILRAKQETAYFISGLYIEGNPMTLANLEGRAVIYENSFNLDTVDVVGPQAICVGSFDSQNYFVPPVSGATHYIWSVPAIFKDPVGSFLVNLGAGRWQTPNNAISLFLKEGTVLDSGIISVQAIRQCKQGTPSKEFTITINQPDALVFDKPVELLSNEHPQVLSVVSPANGEIRFSGSGIVKNTFVPNLILGPYPRTVTIDYVFTSGSTGCVTKGQFDIKVLDGRVPKDMKMWVSRDLDSPFVYFKTHVPTATPAWGWKWTFENQRSNDINPTMALQSPQPQNVSYNLEIKDEKSREYSINKSFQVTIDFNGQQLGKPTQFLKSVDLGASNDKINSQKWDFGDGTTSTDNSPAHTYSQAGSYVVKLTIVAEDFITYELTKRIDIFPIVEVKKNLLYSEQFGNLTHYWATSGKVDSAGILIQRCSWQLKTPAGFGHISADKGKAWVTDNQNLPHATSNQARYYAREHSYVESPSFDITDLQRPTVSFDYWVDTDAGSDGVVLLYTVDDGKTWWRVGQINQGLQWYNSRPILGSPGKYMTNDNIDNQGWSGNRQYEQKEGWQTARFTLDAALEKMLKLSRKIIRFRVAFGSNADDPPNKKFDGFAFDNFQINNRNRLVLMEYFTNQGAAGAAGKDQQAHNFVVTKNEMINLHYHVGFPGPDEANQLNHKDPSGRSFHYGIRQAPQVVIDGSTLESKSLDIEWAERLFYYHTLVMSPFEINIGQAEITKGQLNFSATLTALQAFDKKLVVHAVVVDTAVKMGGEIYHQVVRKMLPDASGTFLAKNWAQGAAHTLSFSWNTGNIPIERLKVVVFVENYETRKVYQAALCKVNFIRNEKNEDHHMVTGVQNVESQAQTIIYPNPATHTVSVTLGKSKGLPAFAQWSVTNAEGKIMKKGILLKPSKQLVVDVHHLPAGIYLVRVQKGQWVVQQKFRKR